MGKGRDCRCCLTIYLLGKEKIFLFVWNYKELIERKLERNSLEAVFCSGKIYK